MRKKDQKQMPLKDGNIDHPRADELKSISLILYNNPIITEIVLEDLLANGV